MLDVHFWENRYESENTPWDLAGPSPHFVAFLKQRPDFFVPGKMAVLGAGRGHDAALFAQAGFEVTGFDYAPGAITLASELYGKFVNFTQADIFALANPDSSYRHAFDYVLEHTCFCAILPAQRADYVRSVENILKPGGYLLGIFWEHNDMDGPPFRTTEAELRQAFGPGFDFISTQNQPAVAGREGIERLVLLRRKTDV